MTSCHSSIAMSFLLLQGTKGPFLVLLSHTFRYCCYAFIGLTSSVWTDTTCSDALFPDSCRTSFFLFSPYVTLHGHNYMHVHTRTIMYILYLYTGICHGRTTTRSVGSGGGGHRGRILPDQPKWGCYGPATGFVWICGQPRDPVAGGLARLSTSPGWSCTYNHPLNLPIIHSNRY